MLSFKLLTKLCCNMFANTLFGLQQVAVEIDDAKMIAINKTLQLKKKDPFSNSISTQWHNKNRHYSYSLDTLVTIK